MQSGRDILRRRLSSLHWWSACSRRPAATRGLVRLRRQALPRHSTRAVPSRQCATSLPRTCLTTPRGLADSYELVRILPAEEAPPPWEISYRVGFTVHPGMASSSSLDGTMFARFFLARDTTTGSWRVWPKSLWVRQYIRDDASQ